MNDITTEKDIKQLVDTFYSEVRQDDLLGPIFNDVARVNWNEHLPLLYRFWSSLLFRTGEYKGRPFPKHAALPIDRSHFERWVGLFHQTVDRLFEGPKAEEAKGFALSIADTFQLKLGLLDPRFQLKITARQE